MSMEQRAVQGEIHVELNSEITLLKDLNDFLMLVCQSTPLAARAGHAVAAGGHGDGPQRHRVGQPPPVRPAGEHHLSHLRRPPGDRGARPGPGVRPEPAAARGRPDDPFTHLDVREKLGLRAGGFGLLICQGMVDEMQIQ